MTPLPVPSIEELEARMQPGALSQSGFLGAGERLGQVMAEDRAALQAAGVTHEALAAALEALLQAALDAPGHKASVGALDVKVEVFPGFQLCPWAADLHHGQCTAGGGVRFGSVHWTLRHRSSGARMEGPGLIVHLARDHHFFEGPKSPMRVEPLQLAQMLGLSDSATPPAPAWFARWFKP